MIQFTPLGTDRHGQDVIAIHSTIEHTTKMRISIGQGLLNKLRQDPQFVESVRLPGERPEKAAA
jgi:hypothetical protein